MKTNLFLAVIAASSYAFLFTACESKEDKARNADLEHKADSAEDQAKQVKKDAKDQVKAAKDDAKAEQDAIKSSADAKEKQLKDEADKIRDEKK